MYDDNPRYEKRGENVYYDNETDEAVFLLSDEEGELMKKILNRQPDAEDGFRLNEDEFNNMFKLGNN